MQRRKPLEPGGPLRRTGRLARSTPMSSGRPAAAKPKPRRPASTGLKQPVREAVIDRDEGLCVLCGGPVNFDDPTQFSLHHLSNRGSGGRHGEARELWNQADNVVLLHGSGTTGCHGKVTAPANFGLTRQQFVDRGLIVSLHHSIPGAVPVLAWDAWYRLHGLTRTRLDLVPPRASPELLDLAHVAGVAALWPQHRDPERAAAELAPLGTWWGDSELLDQIAEHVQTEHVLREQGTAAADAQADVLAVEARLTLDTIAQRLRA